MPLADAVAFLKLTPIFTAILSYFFLKEKLPRIAWLAILIAFIGVIFVLKPTGNLTPKYIFTGVFSGLGAASAYTAVRQLRHYYSARYIVLSFCFVGTITPLIFMYLANFVNIPVLDFLFVKYVSPTPKETLLLITLAVFALSGQIFLTRAYSYSKAGIVSTVGYIAILFSLTFDIFYYHRLPSLTNLFGIALIIACGLAVIYSQKKFTEEEESF